MDKGVYCEKAQYQDNEYICWYTGKPCTITPTPNKYQCHLYDKQNAIRYRVITDR